MSDHVGTDCIKGETAAATVLSSRSKILSFTEGNDEFARQIVAEFLRITPPLLSDMRVAAEKNDRDSMKGYCHRIKGNLAYLGEDRIIKILSGIDCNLFPSEKLNSFFTEMNEMLERLAKEWELPSPLSSGVSQSE